MLRALTGVFAAIFRRASRERQSDRVVWLELPEAPPGRDGWTSLSAHQPGARLLESNGGSVRQIDLVREAEMRVSASGEPTIRITFLDGMAEVCCFGGWRMHSPGDRLKGLVGRYRERCDCRGDQYGSWGPCDLCRESLAAPSDFAVGHPDQGV